VGKASCSLNASNAVFGGADPCPGLPKKLVVQAECTGFFALELSVPVGSTALVRLPLLTSTSGRDAANVTITESAGGVLWADGTFKGGEIAGVVGARADAAAASGAVVEVHVQSGSYQFQLE
jgi:hypothetical protein